MKISKPYIFCTIFLLLFASLIINEGVIGNYFSQDKVLTPQTVYIINVVRIILFCMAIFLFRARKTISDTDIISPPFDFKIMAFPITLILVLVILHIITTGQSYHSFFNLDKEFNFPSWYSSILLGISSFLSFRIFLKLRKSDYFWMLLSLLCLAMSADESIMLHEKLSGFLQVYDNYIIGPLAVILLIGLFYTGCVSLEKKRGYLLYILGGFFIIGLGAVGFDLLGHFFSASSEAYRFFVIIEESFEMLGESVLLVTVMIFHERMG